MRILPRYSLLTLFVFMAIVAGSLKLWHGPHHVVGRPFPDWEIEFTSTRDWRGNQIVQGPVIQRRFAGDKLVFFLVSYCRQGNDANWEYGGYVQKHPHPYEPRRLDENARPPLTPDELQRFHEARDAELQRLTAAGVRLERSYEGQVDHSIIYGGPLGLGR